MSKVEQKHVTTKDQTALDAKLAELKSKGVKFICIGERDRSNSVRCAILDTGHIVHMPYGHNVTWKIEYTSETPLLSTVLYQEGKQMMYANVEYCRLSAGQCWSTYMDSISVTESMFLWLLRHRPAYKNNNNTSQPSITLPYFNESKPLE